MIQNIKFGNILGVEAGLIAQGCNAQGVMGSGLAKAIRTLYPENYTAYSDHHTEHGLFLGNVIIHEVNETLSICNCITQQYYGKDGKKYVSYEGLYIAMKQVAKLASRYKRHVHYPLIGAGLGGGDWAIIQPIIDSAFEKYPGVERTLWINEDGQGAHCNGTY